MRILLINYEYPPVGGGASNATWEIARAMVKLGHEPVVLTARYKHRQPDLENLGIKVIQVAAIRRRKDRCSIWEMTTFVIGASWSIRKILRQEKIEGMIAFFSIPCGPIAWWGWRTTKIPYIISLRGGDIPGNEKNLAFFHFILGPFRRTILSSAQAVTANGERLKARAESVDIIPVTGIPNGIDTKFWHPAPTPPPPLPVRFLYVGRFHAQKNLAQTITELSTIDQEAIPQWQFHLVGDGPELRSIKSLATHLGLQDRIFIYPWLERNDLKKIYQSCHIYINLALYEGVSNSVLEAISCGLYVILSDGAIGDPQLSRSGRVLTWCGNSKASLGSLAKGLIVKHFPPDSIDSMSWATCAQSFVAALTSPINYSHEAHSECGRFARGNPDDR